jgi:hypothetical protein
MRSLQRMLVMVTGVIGALLVVKGVWGGLWPISLQLIVGVLLLVYAFFRLRAFSTR